MRVVLSGPVTESVSARLAVLTRDMDGYIKNTVSGEDEQQEKEDVVRLSVRWDINDAVCAT